MSERNTQRNDAQVRSRPSYRRVWMAFARNSLMREMSFRTNFLINLATELLWCIVMVVFFKVVYQHTHTINGWDQYQYFAFMATSMIINGIIETFFMTNCAEFSEQIRTGNLDFALLKPIDTQFLVSLQKIDWSVLSNLVFAGGMLAYALNHLDHSIGAWDVLSYALFVAAGVAIFYSIMLTLTSASVWMGRNSGLHEFWFYVTVFARYPRNVYEGSLGLPLSIILTYGLPILLVVSVPAEVLANKPLFEPPLAAVALAGAVACLLISRWIFRRALVGYRSASS